MKSKFMVCCLALSSFAFVPTISFAKASIADKDDKASSSVRTLTGCLSRGEKAGEFNLVAEDGSTWEVHSKAVRLGKHVGHTVTVTGSVWHAKMHGMKEKTKSEVDADSSEHGHLKVTGIDMVSPSCKK